MIRVIFLFLVLGAGLFVGTQYAGQQGYVLISMANKTIEMSVTTLVVFIIIALAALFLLEYVIKKALSASSLTWNWFSIRKLKRSRRFTNEGIIKLLEGDFKAAEKKVMRWSNHHDMPLLCYLVASEAALGQGDIEKQNKYLELASQQENSELAVGLTKAKQQIRSKLFSQAADTLASLNKQFPSNRTALELKKTVLLELKQWQPLLDLLPQLNKAKRVSDAEHEQLTMLAHEGLMHDIAEQKGSEELIQYWYTLPRKLKNQPQLIQQFVHQLIVRKADHEAFNTLKATLKKQPIPALYALLPELNLNDDQVVISFLQDALRRDARNAEAHSALGQIYLREQKWQEAQKHFEAALTQRSNVSDYAYLADALDKQNLTQAAHEVAHKALTLAKES